METTKFPRQREKVINCVLFFWTTCACRTRYKTNTRCHGQVLCLFRLVRHRCPYAQCVASLTLLCLLFLLLNFCFTSLFDEQENAVGLGWQDKICFVFKHKRPSDHHLQLSINSGQDNS